jgi:hypothetical protein
MASPAQLTANRSNAQLSSGPVSAEGKARVAQNALKHGLTAKHLVVREDEREEFETHRASLLKECAPEGALEMIVFNEALHQSWNLERYRRIETENSTGTAEDFTDPQKAAFLDRLSRYQARAQRALYRALAELRKLQTDRALRACTLDSEEQETVPPLADIVKWTKQTQGEPFEGLLRQAVALGDHQTRMAIKDFRRQYEAEKAQK